MDLHSPMSPTSPTHQKKTYEHIKLISMHFKAMCYTYEPNTYKIACTPSEDSGRLAYPHSPISLRRQSMGIQESKPSAGGQRRLTKLLMRSLICVVAWRTYNL